MIPLIDPADSAWYEFDWTSALPTSVTVTSVTHTLPSPLTKVSESTSTPTSAVRVSGAVHGKVYMVEAAATLSNGEVINRQFPLRAFNG